MTIFEGKFDTTNYFRKRNGKITIIFMIFTTILAFSILFLMYSPEVYISLALLGLIIVGLIAGAIIKNLPVSGHESDYLFFAKENGRLVIEVNGKCFASFKSPIGTEPFKASTVTGAKQGGAIIMAINCLEVYNWSKSITFVEEISGMVEQTRTKLINPDIVAKNGGTIDRLHAALIENFSDQENGEDYENSTNEQSQKTGNSAEIPKDINF